MSRSFRHTAKTGNVHRISEATDKQHWHQRLRVRIRTTMARLQSDLEGYWDPDKREVSQRESMSKHGKHFISPTQFEALAEVGEKRKLLGLCK